MFLFKKLLTPFLLTPGLFSALAFCVAALRFKKDRAQALVWGGFAMLIWAASTAPVGDMALARLEYAYLPPGELKADVIVLLTGGFRKALPSLSAIRNSQAYR